MTHTGDGGERDLDKRLASGVRVVPLAPEATGFNAWSRKEEPHRSALPHPRRVPEPEPKPESEPVPDPAPEPVPALSPGGGTAEWLVPEGAEDKAERVLFLHGGGYTLSPEP